MPKYSKRKVTQVKVLVFGAGVLGSYLAHVLCRGGNDVTAQETRKMIRERSRTPKQVVFAFQSMGGRRDNGRVISIYFATSKLGCGMTAGALDEDASWRPLLEKAFAKTSYRVRIGGWMDAWLKSHVAFVLPIGFACYYTGGNLKKIAGNRRFLNRMIDAVRDGYRVVEACGYPVEPQDDKNFVMNHMNHRFECYLMFKLMAATPIGRLACSDHAMSAKAEMRMLYDDFDVLKQKSGITTPAWDELARYMIEATGTGEG